MLNRMVLFAIGCILFVGLNGCNESPARYPVAGKIVIDGDPVTKGSIQFVPTSGRPFASKIASDGSFRLVEANLNSNLNPQGIAPGKYRIGISSREVIDEDKGEVLNHIPLHYADYRKSQLEIEIDSPREDMLIELTWEGTKKNEERAKGDKATDEETPQAADGSGSTLVTGGLD